MLITVKPETPQRLMPAQAEIVALLRQRPHTVAELAALTGRKADNVRCLVSKASRLVEIKSDRRVMWIDN